MISKILFFICFSAATNIAAQDNEFSLTGKTAGIEDGTYLYFRDLVNGGNIDSALVKNNKFRFTTDLPEPALWVMLFTKDRKYSTQLWLENNPMTFDASNADFKNPEVTGSRNHSLYEGRKEEVEKNAHLSPEERQKNHHEFIKKHPDALVSAYLLTVNDKWDQKTVRNLYSHLSEDVQFSSMGELIADRLKEDLPEEGEQFIDLSIPDSKGKIQKISDLMGDLTLIQFWASWCGGSRKMNSTLTELYKECNAEGFNIVSISGDGEREKWTAAIREDDLSWPQLSSLNGWEGKAFEAYGVNITPSSFLINGEGIIVARNLRDEEIEQKIQQFLEK